MWLQDFCKQKRFHDVYVLARYFYRIGKPIMDDTTYEILEKAVEDVYKTELESFFSRTYDDDPTPFVLLEEIGVEPILPTIDEEHQELVKVLDEDKSFSIRSVTNYQEAFQYFQWLREIQKDFMVSLKMDGINTKALYLNGEFALSMSRGRTGNGFDFTSTSRYVMPEKINVHKEELKIVGESFVLYDKLEYLRDKYDKDGYKTAKSAATSMLRVKHDVNDYRFLKTVVFATDGLAHTLQETFDKLEKEGVTVVPHFKLGWKEIPETFDSFCSWLKEAIFDRMYNMGIDYPSDGVVIEIDDLGFLGTENEKYISRQLALKFEYWAYEYFVGIVKDIHIEQQRVFHSVRIEIEPMKTNDGCNACIINSFNPAILIDEDLYIGKKVYFERNSGAVNILLHHDKLKKLLSEG